jgi:hypothetical protein
LTGEGDHQPDTGHSSEPARRLLIFASVVTLALNVAEPIVAGEYGKAAFDTVGAATDDRLGRSGPRTPAEHGGILL